MILSGLLPHQAPGVIAAYRARGLVPLRHLRIEGWSSLLLRKVRLRTLIRWVVRIAGDDALFLLNVRLTRASDETVQDLDDDAALLFWRSEGSGRGRTGGEIFSNVKAGIVYPLVVELKHSWSPPGIAELNGLRRQTVPIRSNADRLYSSIIYAKLWPTVGRIADLLHRNPKVIRRCSKPISRHSKNPKAAWR